MKIASRALLAIIAALFFFFGALLVGACGWGIPVVPAPPTPTPTPMATPTPTPVPTPTPLPDRACRLAPSGPGQCRDRPGFYSPFTGDVDRAQRQAEANGFVRDGVVLDERAYVGEVARLLRLEGLCATSEGLADEVWVKDSNDFSDHFDIVTGDQRVWRLFAARCIPAQF